MPEYLFTNEATGETHAVFYHMNDIKDYRGPDGKAKSGVWKRVWTKPQMAIDAFVADPYSPKDFARVTRKPGTMGDLWDRSSEWSEKRRTKDGVDPLQQKFFNDYQRKHKGRKHPKQQLEEKRAKTDAALKKAGIKVDWGED